MAKKRWYIGYDRTSDFPEIFQSEEEPTYKSFGERYGFCAGPFPTKRGATWLYHHPKTGLHKTIEEIEKIAKQEEGTRGAA